MLRIKMRFIQHEIPSRLKPDVGGLEVMRLHEDGTINFRGDPAMSPRSVVPRFDVSSMSAGRCLVLLSLF